MTANQYSSVVQNDLTAIIANSGDTSAAVDLYGCTLCGIQMPASFTGTALTFLASVDNSTFQEVYYGGSALSETVAQAKYISLDPSKFAGIRYIKFKSGSTEGGERTLQLAVRPV